MSHSFKIISRQLILKVKDRTKYIIRKIEKCKREKKPHQNIDMDCRWTTSRIHLFKFIICKLLLSYFVVVLPTNIWFKTRILSWETATFPVKPISVLSHAFGNRTLIVHTAELTRLDANYCFIYSRCNAPTVQPSCDSNLELLIQLF